MELSIQVNPQERAVRLREVHALAAGDVYNPVTLLNVEGAQTAALQLRLFKDSTATEMLAQCSSFAEVPGHRSRRRGVLTLATQAMKAWYGSLANDATATDTNGMPSALVNAWLVISDSTKVWAACSVPLILRAMDTNVVQGADGISPTVSVTKSGSVTTISITDVNGTHTETVNDGRDGEDGGSPTMLVDRNPSTGNTRVTVVNVDGSTSSEDVEVESVVASVCEGINLKPNATARDMLTCLQSVLLRLGGTVASILVSAMCLADPPAGMAPFGDLGMDVSVVTNADQAADVTGRLAGKQDALPYPTNAIPASAVSGLPPPASLARLSDIEAHTNRTDNPHNVTAAQVGAYTKGQTDGAISAATNAMEAVGTAHQIVRGSFNHDENVWNMTVSYANSANEAGRAGSANYADMVPWIGIEDTPTTLGGYGVAEDATNVVYGIVTQVVAASNPTFSNAVLAVGLNIDTNSVAVLNEIASTFGDFPIEGTATTVGGLLAALAAAIAWLRKNKADKATTLAGYGITDAATMASIAPEYSPSSAYAVGAFVYHDCNIYQCKTAIADGGEAWNAEHWELRKLDDFFTEANGLLTATIDARLPYPLYAVPSTGLLKDCAINTTSLASVTVPDNFTDLIVRATVASSLSVTMPNAIATKYGDTFPGEAGEYLITITKTGAAEAYVRTIKLEVANA